MINLLSIKDASNLLGVHPETLRRWDKEGKLSAVRMGKRRDRKYRQNDLTEILTGMTPEKYKGYCISSYSGGFQRLPDRLIRVVSFAVTYDQTISVFAFTDGGVLLHMSHSNITDDHLIGEAKKIIRGYIDENKIENLEEYTFEYHPKKYLLVSKPLWWNKTLKKQYA